MAIVVDEPIVNSPFEEPARHYRYRAGAPALVEERRPSGYMPGLRTSRGGAAQTLVEEEFVPLPLVNDVRERVRRWREAGYPGATRTTLDLLRHWRGPARERRLFFCQLEAAETAIWLVEGPQSETGRLPLEQQERYRRHCLKMATGSGKTVVMAMLIAWSVLNKARQPTDRRFSDAVLVLCPNLTVRERLEVLRPAASGNYYEAFDLLPPGLGSALLGGRVMVTNWHALADPGRLPPTWGREARARVRGRLRQPGAAGRAGRQGQPAGAQRRGPPCLAWTLEGGRGPFTRAGGRRAGGRLRQSIRRGGGGARLAQRAGPDPSGSRHQPRPRLLGDALLPVRLGTRRGRALRLDRRATSASSTPSSRAS